MTKALEIIFSNQLEILYQKLKYSLYGPSSTHPLLRRLVVVYGPAMKTWLMLKMAQDPELNVATGIEFIYLNQAFEFLIKLSAKDNIHFPSFLELALFIEKELKSVVRQFNHFDEDERHVWEPLIHYLKLQGKEHLSIKEERRMHTLSEHLARLFQDYGRYAFDMVSKWENGADKEWQSRIWRKVFGDKMGWKYPSRALHESVPPAESFTLHFFSISFLTLPEFNFLERVAEQVPTFYYLLSPCAVFWSDICSDRERASLQKYWQKKLGNDSAQIVQLEELLRDSNPLLANFGRLGREMACQIEESSANTKAVYILPKSVQPLHQEAVMDSDFQLIESEAPLSLLHALQADLLTMRNPQGSQPINLEQEDGSIQMHIAPNRRREVQILYHNLLGLMAKDPTITPSDILVMAPQMGEYVPYIQSVFGNRQSAIDFQILDLGMQSQSEIVQGFLLLLNLSESRWDASQLLQLFAYPTFQKRHQLSLSDYTTIQDWIKKGAILWGKDREHRNEFLQRRHCRHGMVDESAIGTWDYGLSRLLVGLTMITSPFSKTASEFFPCSIVDFSQGELLGKWIQLLEALRDDLSPFHDRTHMTIEEWADYLACLLENYFEPEGEHYEELKRQLEILKKSAQFLKDDLYTFISIKSHLMTLLDECGLTYREDHLQAVRFCSLLPLRSIPAKVIAMMGMQAGAFPRINEPSSLNLFLDQGNGDYYPLSNDYDRYLFLEALHTAQDYLLFSFSANGEDKNESHPSLVLEELFSYLENNYMLGGEKVSKRSIFKHPFDLFDQAYFTKGTGLQNYSWHDYQMAQIHCKGEKKNPYSFIVNFNYADPSPMDTLPNKSIIDIKDLHSLVRDPIKFHFNKILDIYLQTEEGRTIKTEEDFLITPLEKYQLKQSSLKEPLELVLARAEREGKLPQGVFKAVANKWIKEEFEEVSQDLQKFSLNVSNIFQMEFCTSCLAPKQIDENKWLFPALNLSYDEGYELSIIGKLSHATAKGLLSFSKGTFPEIWKSWPHFLLYCHGARMLPDKFAPLLILTESSQPKRAFFDDPAPYLKQLIRYYDLCHRHFSPLLPEWIPPLIAEDQGMIQDKLKKLHADAFGAYQNHYLLWGLSKHHLPTAPHLIETWKNEAENLVGDIVRFWIEKGAGHEAI